VVLDGRLRRAGEGARLPPPPPRRRALMSQPGGPSRHPDMSDTRAFAGSAAVVNLLTRIRPLARMLLPGAWRENERLRREASRAVAVAAGQVGA